jgi:hypothetical protein
VPIAVGAAATGGGGGTAAAVETTEQEGAVQAPSTRSPVSAAEIALRWEKNLAFHEGEVRWGNIPDAINVPKERIMQCFNFMTYRMRFAPFVGGTWAPSIGKSVSKLNEEFDRVFGVYMTNWAMRMGRHNKLETFKSLMYEMAKHAANSSKRGQVRAIKAWIKEAGIDLPTVGK